MTTGTCLCGDVRWEVAGDLALVSHCHCSRCRKAHGTATGSYVMAPAGGVRIVQGRDGIASFASSPGFARPFCRRCGAVVPDGRTQDGHSHSPVGGLADDAPIRPKLHIFAASRAPWYELTDGLPAFDAWPPGFEQPSLPSPERPAPEPGEVRGGCLCGDVAFTLTRPATTARYCHCGRCRRGRAAPFASNLAVPLEGLRWDRGEDRVASYKVPEARFFMQCFCPRCGGKLPRADASRGIAVVPLGALDDDPGIRPLHHIFVASKAPWHEITDALPQHPEYPPE